MIYRLFTAIIAALGIAFSATSAETSNALRRYELNVNDFDELKVIEGLRVDYSCNADSAGMVSFLATPDVASVLMFNNNKGHLEMQISTDGIAYTDLPVIKVYSRFLSKVENSGDSLVRILSLAPAPMLKLRLIGNGRLSVHGVDANTLDASLETGNGIIFVEGKALAAKYRVVGTGSIQVDDLKASQVKCTLLGTGFIGCSAAEMLNVVGGGTGKVYYHGDPVIKNRTMGVKILPAE